MALNINLNAQQIDSDTTVYEKVDIIPVSSLSTGELFKFIGQNLKIDTTFKEQGIEGSVYFEFIIEKDGTTSNYKIRRGVNAFLPAIETCFKRLPLWKPAIMNEKAVRYRYSFRISCIKLE